MGSVVDETGFILTNKSVIPRQVLVNIGGRLVDCHANHWISKIAFPVLGMLPYFEK